MSLSSLDWAILLGYIAFAVGVGLWFRRRASRNVDEYFLSGRTLPWWLAGTSMVATSFAADTPLLVSGWVRAGGIWKNWAWWCFAISGMLGVFLFSRWWRRGRVMTKAEFAELRYGNREGSLLRGFLGIFHAFFVNTITLCWVLVAAQKIISVSFGYDKGYAIILACAIALSYSLLSGFWGVVVTDFFQFLISAVGALVLAYVAWNAVGGLEGIEAGEASGSILAGQLDFFPAAGPGGFFSSEFWTTALAVTVVYLGVSWWAAENVDGGGPAIQRIAASRDPRQGMLAVLWYNLVHYVLRPWPWIIVGVASLVLLPRLSVESPVAGTINAIIQSGEPIRTTAIQILPENVDEIVSVPLAASDARGDWYPEKLTSIVEGSQVQTGTLLAQTDPERAYVVMMTRYLGIGWLGLVLASLMAAFMSTIDTHVNLASSFFVNDVYRRFLRKDREADHYVLVARLASVLVLFIGAVLAYNAKSISSLFLFLLSFLGGVGPISVMRWLWWRVRASTEITALCASALSTSILTVLAESGVSFSLGPLTPGGELLPEGRLLLVVAISMVAAVIALLLAGKPRPESLVPFYRRVRPLGWWGPVAALAPEVVPQGSLVSAVLGVLGGLATIYGGILCIGGLLLGRASLGMISAIVSVAGIALMLWSLKQFQNEEDRQPESCTASGTSSDTRDEAMGEKHV